LRPGPDRLGAQVLISPRYDRFHANVRLYTTTFRGLITSGALAGQNFKTNGVLTPFVHGTRVAGSPLVEIGGDGACCDDSMEALLRSQQMFARAPRFAVIAARRLLSRIPANAPIWDRLRHFSLNSWSKRRIG
jgi:hypothetical protein